MQARSYNNCAPGADVRGNLSPIFIGLWAGRVTFPILPPRTPLPARNWLVPFGRVFETVDVFSWAKAALFLGSPSILAHDFSHPEPQSAGGQGQCPTPPRDSPLPFVFQVRSWSPFGRGLTSSMSWWSWTDYSWLSCWADSVSLGGQGKKNTDQ